MTVYADIADVRANIRARRKAARDRRRDVTVRIVTWAAILALGWFLNDLRDSSCPSEDSCSIDYRDGSWHIEEVTP